MVATILVIIVSLLHCYFLILEMFLWETPRTRAIFRTDPEFAARSRTLAGNQGLYNGFLAAGLLWGLWLGPDGQAITLFFLICVIIAAIYGAATVSRKIFVVQGVPALLAIAATLWG
jgi:putative membrane protein